jgi:hypothetical protein
MNQHFINSLRRNKKHPDDQKTAGKVHIVEVLGQDPLQQKEFLLIHNFEHGVQI